MKNYVDADPYGSYGSYGSDRRGLDATPGFSGCGYAWTEPH